MVNFISLKLIIDKHPVFIKDAVETFKCEIVSADSTDSVPHTTGSEFPLASTFWSGKNPSPGKCLKRICFIYRSAVS